MKKIVIIVAVVLILIAAIASYKTFVLNNPPETPKEVITVFMDNAEENKQEENKKYLSANFNEETKKDFEESTGDSESSEDLIYTIKEERFVNKNKANVVIEVDAVILKLQIEFVFNKEGNWLSGYAWKIADIKLPDFGSSDTDSTSTVESKKEFKQYKLGELFKTDDWELTIGKISESKTIENTIEGPNGESMSMGEPSTAKGKFVTVQIKAKNIGKEAGYISGLGLKLKDNQDRKYDESSDLFSMVGKETSYSDIQPGFSVSVLVTFDVPTDSVPASLLLEEISIEVILK